MAEPIPLELPPRDGRAELQTQLQNAPLEHAQALLAALEVLQGLHDRGVLEFLRGALGSNDKVSGIIVEAASRPESIRGIRNLISLAKILGTVEPEFIDGLAKAVPEAVAVAKASKPPGFWATLRKLRNRDFRRGLMLVNSMLEALGRNLRSASPGQDDRM